MTQRSFPFLLVLAVALTAFSADKKVRKKLVGHWISAEDICGIEERDTVVMTRSKFTDTLYYWGGPASGFTFESNGDFREYSNTLCSEETNPVRFGGERWHLDSTHDVMIEGDTRKLHFRVITIGSDTLKMKLVEKEMKLEQR
jgi:hypothetical protein